MKIIPYYGTNYGKYYWIKQIDSELSQYLSFSRYVLSKEKLQSWLDYKKNMFDSVMEYTSAKQYKLNRSYYIYFRRYCNGFKFDRYSHLFYSWLKNILNKEI